MAALPQNILDMINTAVTQAAQQAAKETAEALQAAAQPVDHSERNYFKIVEKLLYSYPMLKRLVSDKNAYTKVELQERSRSLVRFSPNTQWKSRDDIIEEMERDKETEYDTTLKDFRRIERVIQQFKDRKEFVVVRLYYFKEHIDGSPRTEDEEAVTWEIVGDELQEAGILREVKTARRWRNTIINDMAICLFGIEAAIQAGTSREG